MARRRNKRDIILQAAEQLFRERRVHELTMDDVAEAAGVGKGTIYNHFDNKDDLLFQIATRGFDQLCDVVAATPAEGRFRDRLVDLCEHVSAFFLERRAVMRMIQEHEGRYRCLSGPMKERWLSHKQRLVQALASVLTQGVWEGAVRDDMPADLLAALLLGMMRARGQEYAHAPGTRPAVAVVVDLFLHGACGASGGEGAGPVA
ncbi:MAG: TetR/AcrR family transcriptional regulator [Planctomycetota bacterium]